MPSRTTFLSCWWRRQPSRASLNPCPFCLRAPLSHIPIPEPQTRTSLLTDLWPGLSVDDRETFPSCIAKTTICVSFRDGEGYQRHQRGAPVPDGVACNFRYLQVLMNLRQPGFRIWNEGPGTATELHATCMAAGESNRHYGFKVGVGGDDGHV